MPLERANGSPKLPLMTPIERELWGNAKGLPDGYTITHISELMRMAGATAGAGKIIDAIFGMLQPVKLPNEEPITTLQRLLRDLGRLTIERDAYKFQCDDEQRAAAEAEIRAKLQPKKK